MLSNIGGGKIEPVGWTYLLGLKTQFQSFVTNACGFLYGDLVGSSEESDWRIYCDKSRFRGA
jgi:hypothetical protein